MFSVIGKSTYEGTGELWPGLAPGAEPLQRSPEWADGRRSKGFRCGVESWSMTNAKRC